MTNVEFRFFTRDDCPRELFEFRYAIYIEEMHRKQFYACHETRTIIDPLDETGRQLIGFSGGEIVACVRANLLSDGPVGDYFSFYGMDALDPAAALRSSICTRLMVRADFRKTQVPVDIFKRLYDFAIENRVETSYMDCNAHLVRFFRKFGYEFLGVKAHPEYGEVSIMKLDHFAFARLVSIGSPFAEQAARELARSPPAISAAE
ncbi:MAG: N-acyl amino acid synthase FeeM domain-containing protein [Parvularculaceae bacterium]